jgi:2-dehydropantoate 2-reductase
MAQGMKMKDKIYVLGAGAIGLSLATYLFIKGKEVIAVRTSTDEVDSKQVEIAITGADERIWTAPIEMVSLAKLRVLDGVIVVTAKSYANDTIATRLKGMEISSPLVIMQNGVGVENPYLNLDTARIYRCVLYSTSQKDKNDSYKFVSITASPIGIVRGNEQELDYLVNELNTTAFPFVSHSDIKQEVWKKAIMNAVFNSICPLLEIDNGIFVRDEKASLLAQEIVDECLVIAHNIGIRLNAEEIMQQIFAISKKSEGQLISTLQDINAGRETEIDYLNLEIARLGETLIPAIKASTTKALGEIVKMKSKLRNKSIAAG